MILIEKGLLELFAKKNCKKANQKVFRIEKVIKGEDYNYMLNGKYTTIPLIVGLIKKHSINEWIFSKTRVFRTECES